MRVEEEADDISTCWGVVVVVCVRRLTGRPWRTRQKERGCCRGQNGREVTEIEKEVVIRCML